MFSDSDIRKGRILASSYFLNEYRTSDQEWDDKAILGVQLAYVWGAEKYGWAFVLKGAQWSAKRLAIAAFTTGPGLAVSVPVIIGGVVSTAIDGEEGFFNYVDFLEDVITLDKDDISDKLTFTWDVLVMKDGRAGTGGRWATDRGRDFWNKRMQEKTDRDYRRDNPHKFPPTVYEWESIGFGLNRRTR